MKITKMQKKYTKNISIKIKKKIKLIIFDFDGVLIDSKKNMEISWESVKKKTESSIEFSKYFNKIGLPFFKILKKIKFDRNFKQAKKIYDETSLNNLNTIKLFPGVRKFLKKISTKYVLVLITSKSKDRTKKILKKLNLNFDHVFCPEDRFKSKPNPEVINYIKKKYNLKKHELIIIGDSLTDKKLAQNAKIKFIFAKYGYYKLVSQHKIKRIDELSKYI